MKSEKTVKITISQSDVERAVRTLIAEQDSSLIVEEINFLPKRNGPDKIAVTVNASFAPVVTEPLQEVLVRGDVGLPEGEEVPITVADTLINNDLLPEPVEEEVIEEEKPSVTEVIGTRKLEPAKVTTTAPKKPTMTREEVKSKLFQ